MSSRTTPASPRALAPPEPPAGRSVRTRLRGVLPVLGSLQGYIGLVLVIAAGMLTKGQVFWNQQNLTNAVGAFASRGILAVGETLVILTAGIDLSVGSLLGIASMVSALLLVHQNMNIYEIVPLCMVVGALFGLANGAATALLRIQSFVVTLAMLNVVRGIDRMLSNNVSVGTQLINAQGQLTPRSAQFQVLGTPGHNILTGLPLPLLGRAGIYYPVLALIVVVVVFQLLLSKSKFGRHIYAVGGNETAARLSGVNTTYVKIAVFMLAGLLAGFAGPIDAAYSASADPLAGSSYELDAIAAVVIGGASLAGGRGSIVGTLVGSLILTLLDNVLGLNAISDNAQLIIKGLIVILAVVIQRPDFFRALGPSVRRLGRQIHTRTGDPPGTAANTSPQPQPATPPLEESR
ncbi:MAG TPA: ABC transporter permease [Rugosimonospora sp.]